MGYFDNEDEETNSDQENYLDDSFGSFTRNLPIDQPSGSIVSGGREDLYHKYSQLLDQKPESERVLEDYMGRRPTHANYVPSGRDKLTAAVMGGIAGINHGGEAGINTAQRWVDKPLDEALQDYNSEGKFVNEYAKLADSSRNRQMTSLLSQMRMSEQQRMDQARMQNLGSLESARKQRLADKSSEDEFKKNKDSRDFTALERHRRAMEAKRIGLNDPESIDGVTGKGGGLDTFQKAGLREFERARGKGTVLDSLGFGAPGSDSYPAPMINPITGQPYTKADIALMGTRANSREFNK